MNKWLMIGIGVFLGFVVVLIIVLALGKKYRREKEAKNAQLTAKNPEAKQSKEEKPEKVKEEVAEQEEPEKKPQPKAQKAKKAEPKKEEKKVEPKKKEPKQEKKENKEQKNVDENETYRIVYDKEQKNWIVRIDGGQRASRRCKTKAEALEVAKELAKKKDADLSVHKKNGKFQKQK